jgi:hypothetical protein
MTGLSSVNKPSKSRSDKPCGCSGSGWSLQRSTTLMNRASSSAVSDRGLLVQILKVERLIRNDYFNVVLTAKTVAGN